MFTQDLFSSPFILVAMMTVDPPFFPEDIGQTKALAAATGVQKEIILHQPLTAISAFDFCFGVDGCSFKKIVFVWNRTLLLKFDGAPQTSWTI